MRHVALLACALAGCGGPAATPARGPVAPASTAPRMAVTDATPATSVTAPEVWLKGSTHVHAKPSGDSVTPIPDVIAWYEQRGYDFIVLSDHNRVSEVDPAARTHGEVAVRAPGRGLIVLAGIELTHNPVGCVPPGDASRQCRIHVNLLGVTARPSGKLRWAAYDTHDRLAKYQAALDQQQQLGGIAQLNHPNWFWGMNADLLAELARRGLALVELANLQFSRWNDGDEVHPGIEALWDAALARGVTLWGVASDDAHAYGNPGKYPAGGAWVVVKARRDPHAIVRALAAGRFYASTGVVLERAEVDADELVVEVAASEAGTYTIEFIENGARVERVRARRARRAVPATGYVRAVVTRGDGTRAWVQPARRP